MANWLNITDAQLTAYRPYLARWVAGVRDNLDAVAQRVVLAHGPATGGPTFGISGGSYGTPGDLLRIYIPDFLVGTGGTRLTALGRIFVEVGDELHFRLEAGGEVGEEQIAFGGLGGVYRNVDNSVTWTPTKDAIATIQANSYVALGASSSWLFGSDLAPSQEGVLLLRRVDI